MITLLEKDEWITKCSVCEEVKTMKYINNQKDEWWTCCDQCQNKTPKYNSGGGDWNRVQDPRAHRGVKKEL